MTPLHASIWALVAGPTTTSAAAWAHCDWLRETGGQEALHLATAAGFFSVQELTRSSADRPLSNLRPPVPSYVRKTLRGHAVLDQTWAVLVSIAVAGYVGASDPLLGRELDELHTTGGTDAVYASLWWSRWSLGVITEADPADAPRRHAVVRELLDATPATWPASPHRDRTGPASELRSAS